jgi:formylmethanofuran dehydrogenase subunit A
MDKEQAIQNFWSQFGIPAYDENSVPDDLRYPFITYSVSTDMLDDVVSLYGNIFYRSPSWKDITKKKEQIAEYIGAGGVAVKIDTGYVYFCQGTPFAQRMSEPGDDMVKRYYIQLQAEFLTPY